MDNTLDDALNSHPCYSEEAHKKFARMHLPVAPRCNIQCNYCNRKYDCSNESRPGVTSEVLSPEEAADKIAYVKERMPELKVIGIAGPGDPLANEETFETIRLVKERFPELTLCISTNGLALPDNAQRLWDLGVRFLTVTMNAIDPAVSEKVYGFVIWNGKRYEGREGAEILLKNQFAGIQKCVELGMKVKINVVLVPGINDEHIPELVKKVQDMGVYIVNILPLIPVEGTAFADRRAPTPEERKKLMDLCSGSARMMRHCRQCRADAIGLLDNDRSQEFIRERACGSGCGPSKTTPIIDLDNIMKIAVASDDGVNVDSGFGNAGVFKTYIYDGKLKLAGDIIVSKPDTVYGESHQKHLSNVIERLSQYDVIIVREIGPRPMNELSEMGKKVVIAKGPIAEAVARVTQEE